MAEPYLWAQSTIRDILGNPVYCGDTVNFQTYSKSNKLKKRLKNSPSKIHTKLSSAENYSIWCNGTLQGANAPISKARWTSMQETSSAVNVVKNSTFTEEKASSPNATSFNAVDIRPKAVSIARHTISENRFSIKLFSTSSNR